MLFNCVQCGKNISTNFEKCPYCLTSIVEVSHEITGIVIKQKKPISEKRDFRGTITSFLTKPKAT